MVFVTLLGRLEVRQEGVVELDGDDVAVLCPDLREQREQELAADSVKTADADDLLALAQVHDADAVVSGDPHLLDAASAVQVLTPRELANRLGLAPMG